MPYTFTNDNLQHLRDCPICGKVIESAKVEFVPIEDSENMIYRHYDGSFCFTPQTESELPQP